MPPEAATGQPCEHICRNIPSRLPLRGCKRSSSCSSLQVLGRGIYEWVRSRLDPNCPPTPPPRNAPGQFPSDATGSKNTVKALFSPVGLDCQSSVGGRSRSGPAPDPRDTQRRARARTIEPCLRAKNQRVEPQGLIRLGTSQQRKEWNRCLQSAPYRPAGSTTTTTRNSCH